MWAFSPATFLKGDYNTGVPSGYWKCFKNSFFIEFLRWLLLTVLPPYSKVSRGICSLVSRLRVLLILIKTFHKTLHYCLLSRAKTISCLLEVIDHVLLISEYALENISCFWFWWKTCTKRWLLDLFSPRPPALIFC